MRRALFLSIGLAFGACALPSEDEFTSGFKADGGSSSSSSGMPSEAGALDAGDSGNVVSIDSGDSGDSGGGSTADNLMKDPGFEDGTCGGAGFYQGTGGASATAKSGGYSCQACRQDESIDAYTFNPPFAPDPPVVGETYRARAWVKVGADTFKEQHVSVIVRTSNATPAYAVVETATSASFVVTADWQRFEAKLTVTKPAQKVELYLEVTTLATAGQRCVLVDDIELTRQ